MPPTLASWPDVLAYLSERYKTSRIDANAVTVALTVARRLTVSRAPGDRVELLAHVCVEQQMATRAALARSRTLAVGGLVLDTRGYHVRHLLPAPVAADHLDVALAEVAAAAAALKAETAPRAQPDVFANYSG